MSNTCVLMSVACFIVSLCLFFPQSATALHGGAKEEGVRVPVAGKHGTVVTQDRRRVVVATEFGEISMVKVSDGRDGFYDLQFITMEPNSLFVPVHLHSDMVFYVNSGSGTLSWVDLEKDKGKLKQVELRTGDVYRLGTGSFFYLQSNLESDRRKFRINAIFSDSKEEIREGSSFGAYSSIGDLLLGFDDKVLQAALNVDEAVIQELRSVGQQQMIVHGVSKVTKLFEMHYRSMRAFLGLIDDNGMIEVNKNKKGKAYNILEAKHDVENCNGWSLVVTSKQLDALKDSDFGIFMVNLTKGAMMGPHWNPLTAEIAIVLSGRGMVHVVCPSTLDESKCKNTRFRVEEGDVFVVPRYHSMAQISFNNGSFVFMGFTTTQKNNHPQYLVGSASVFQVLDKRVLAASLGVSNTTMDELLSAQNDAIILECTSCAEEEEERLMEEEIQRQKEEEAREREEEERKREEEEEARRQEEEARKREEEEAARREQEEAQKREEEEEAARREQEEQEAKRRQEEEEAARKREEEEAAARQQEEEAARRRQEEEAAATRRRQEEEEAAQKQEEEAERRRQEEEELARQKREQEEAAAKKREQEEVIRRQQEEAMRVKHEKDAARQQEAAMRRKQEEEAARQQEEAMRRKQEEEGARQHEAATRRQQEEEAARQQEEAMRRQQEEEAARKQKQEEAARRQKQEEEGARQQEAGSGGSRHQAQGEGEAARKKEEEMARRAREADQAAASRRGDPGVGIKTTEIEDNPQSIQSEN